MLTVQKKCKLELFNPLICFTFVYTVYWIHCKCFKIIFMSFRNANEIEKKKSKMLKKKVSK